MIERQLAPIGAVVTESRMVLDSQTGALREVDVYIEHMIGQHAVTVAIECVDHSRPADVHWVEGMIQKHQDIATSKLVLVSRSGFTRSAREKAEKRGVSTLTIDQAAKSDWSAAVNDLRSISFRQIVAWIGARITVEFPNDDPAPELPERPVLYSADDRVGYIDEVVLGTVNSAFFQQIVLSKIAADSIGAIATVGIHVEGSHQLSDVEGVRHVMSEVRFSAALVLVDHEVPVGRFSYGKLQVASAAHDADAGHINLAVIAQKDRPTTIAISVRPRQAPKSRQLPSFTINSIDHFDIKAMQQGPIDWSTVLNSLDES